MKTLGRSRMKIQEASTDFTEGGILFPGPKITYMEVNSQKTMKKQRIWARKAHPCVTPPLGGHVMFEADEGGEWSGSWHASRQN
jgi:hypothetical protein